MQSCNLLLLGAVECPTCRTQHGLPSKGVEGFTTNYIAMSKQEADSSNTTSSSVICENEVDTNTATSKCLECDFHLCGDCTAVHRKQRATKNHKIVSLTELKKGGAGLEQKRYCSAHLKEEVILYCRTCQEVICRDCTIVTHKQHDYVFIKDVREELSKRMKEMSAGVETKESDLRAFIDCMYKTAQGEKQKVTAGEAKIASLYDGGIAKTQARIAELQEHVAKLQQYKALLTKKLSDASTSYLRELAIQERDLQFSRAGLVGAITFSQQLLSSSNTDLAMMYKQVTTQLQALNQLQLLDISTVKSSDWSLEISEESLLKGQVINVPVSLLAELITVSDLPNPALLGKNTFKVSLNKVPAAAKMEAQVKVTTSSGATCPTKLESAGCHVWSISYYVSPPCPKQVVVAVTVNGVEPKQGPVTLHCLSKMASGTRVKRKKKQNELGTVVVDKLTFGVDPSSTKVQWDGDSYFTSLEQLSELLVVPE